MAENFAMFFQSAIEEKQRIEGQRFYTNTAVFRRKLNVLFREDKNG